MDNERRRVEEWHDFNLFRRCTDDLPDASDLFHPGRPDFRLVTTDGSVLGIEHTRVFISQRDKQRDQETARTVKQAHDRAIEAGLPTVSVIVDFSHHNSPRKAARERVALALFEAVQKHILQGNVSSKFITCGLPPEINAMRIETDRELLRPSWRINPCGVMLEDCIQVLQSTIDEKNAKFDRYLENCQNCWLLVAASWDSPAAFIDPAKETFAHRFKTRFERVYFLDVWSPKSTRLRTTHNS